jgi:uncharacterized protein YjgD (DUF1641 family)
MSKAATVESTTRARVESLIDELVANGDLDNLIHLARLVGSAQDALSDEMVGRLAATVSGGLDMLDRANRSGVARALPAIASLVENGDLDRIVNLARLVGSAEDALTDDMVGRLARVWSEGLFLVDRLTRSAGFMRMIAVLEREEIQDGLINLLEAFSKASEEAKKAPAPKAGLRAAAKRISDSDTQAALHFLANVSRNLTSKE